MELTVFGTVFGPLLLMLVALSILQGKGKKALMILSGILYCMAALFLLVGSSPVISVPQLLWKLLTLATVAVLFLISIRDKHYGLSVLFFVQAFTLVITEILISPGEPEIFLQVQHEEKLLFLTGAFILSISLPILLQHVSQYVETLERKKKRENDCNIGILLMMASFAGLIASSSMTGLFLFGQWACLAGRFLRRAFRRQDIKRRSPVPLLQQTVLTLWIIVTTFIQSNIGLPVMSELDGIKNTTGPMAVFVVLTVIVMGSSIPDKMIAKSYDGFPVSVTGLSMILFSLLTPFTVLLKFRPLLTSIDKNLIYPIVLLGGLVMAANGFYAGLSRDGGKILSHMVLFVAGWGIVSVFTGPDGIHFSIGYIVATAVSIAFLFSCISAGATISIREDDDTTVSRTGSGRMLRIFGVAALLLFIFVPFASSLLGVSFVMLMTEYALAMLPAAAGVVLMLCVIVRWVLILLQIPTDTEETGRKPQGIPILLLSAFFIAVVVVNLLPGPIYRYLQGFSSQTAAFSGADLSQFTGIAGITDVYLSGSGGIYFGLSIIIPAVLLLILRRRVNDPQPVEKPPVVYPDSLFPWASSDKTMILLIRAAWVTTIIILLGVSLSCLKV